MFPKKTTIAFILASLALSAPLLAADPAPPAPRPQTDTEKKAIDFLLTKQDDSGAWIPQAGPGLTALILKGLLKAGHTTDELPVQKALAFLDKSHQSDGGYYTNAQATYNTAITLTALAALPPATREKYKVQIEDAQKFLKSIQSGVGSAASDDKGNIVDKKHPWFGGWGYGEGTTLKPGRRPDLSNTHFVIEALRDSGVPADDPAIQNALIFLTHSQASESNDLPWAKGQNDGGSIYSMGFNKDHNFYGQSEGKDTTDRDGNAVLTTYGSMTYANLKSMLYADLKKDDPRVKAALKWISNNYSLEVNPGLNTPDGLFYYYHVYAAALSALGEDTITDSKGVKHDWRKEFQDLMAKKQAPDGSFVNTSQRWMENSPILATAFVVLSLQDVRK